ncbi:Hypp8453 [Branchiostoma lanceolatum]|uniref:Hypp8453 protein n=1 Tax=Branchiostoma lanceolatum TaxID=7740 RepID=A0A8J9Z866_BRALA|nr:Hypp8453 [Branchiostoma lanceolatum]
MAYGLATKHAEKAGEKGKKYYDRKVYGSGLTEGDHVLVRNVIDRGGLGKLRSYWEDSVYTVVRRMGHGIPVYKVSPECGRGKSKVLHRNMLLPCNGLPLETPPAEQAKRTRTPVVLEGEKDRGSTKRDTPQHPDADPFREEHSSDSDSETEPKERGSTERDTPQYSDADPVQDEHSDSEEEEEPLPVRVRVRELGGRELGGRELESSEVESSEVESSEVESSEVESSEVESSEVESSEVESSEVESSEVESSEVESSEVESSEVESSEVESSEVESSEVESSEVESSEVESSEAESSEAKGSDESHTYIPASPFSALDTRMFSSHPAVMGTTKSSTQRTVRETSESHPDSSRRGGEGN